MRNSGLIAMREFKERVYSRTFLWMLIVGPAVVLFLLFLLFKAGDQGKNSIKVLIADPAGLLENKIVAQEGKAVQYYFISDYLEIEEFRDGKEYQQFDVLMEVNEKVLMNKKVFAFYREQPSGDVKMQLKFQLERRIEEVMIESFTQLSVDAFRQIKQPLNVDYRNVFDPKNQASNTAGWVGFVFGLLIVSFVLLFGMTILRSTAKEKSNRIVEVILASVKPSELMFGKILGIGMAALVQLFAWGFFIAVGLWFFRSFVFPDLFSPANWEGVQMSAEVKQQIIEESISGRYNEFVELIYERIQFGWMLAHFMIFFLTAYLFYGAFFSTIGAMSGTESDGQQFVIPVLVLLGFALYSGYLAIYVPDSPFIAWSQFVPFCSPVVGMVKLAQGYTPGTYYYLPLSWLVLVISTYLLLLLSGRIYKNGILQFGHRARWIFFLRWIKKS